MAVPPTLVMSVNVLFVVCAVFVPGLWGLVECLFPAALVGFLAIGAYALRLYRRYLVRMITTATFDFVANANLSQLVPVSTFAMIAVGFGTSGAMSQEVVINAIGIFLSIFFLSLSVVLGIAVISLIMGLHQGFHTPVPSDPIRKDRLRGDEADRLLPGVLERREGTPQSLRPGVSMNGVLCLRSVFDGFRASPKRLGGKAQPDVPRPHAATGLVEAEKHLGFGFWFN